MCEESSFRFFGILLCIFIAGILIYPLVGEINKNIINKIDKNQITEKYILTYYPEFENCSISYSICIETRPLTCKEGAKIYCSSKNNRGGLKVVTNEKPDYQIVFENLTFEEIVLKLIN